MLVGPSIGTPNIHNLYRKASIISTVFFIAVNSDLKVDAPTEFCLSLNHIAGALLQNKRIPVCDRLISVSRHYLHQRNNVLTCYCLWVQEFVLRDGFTSNPVKLFPITLLELDQTLSSSLDATSNIQRS
jgi:hypothetical protein